jgi:hypothetical protein
MTENKVPVPENKDPQAELAKAAKLRTWGVPLFVIGVLMTSYAPDLLLKMAGGIIGCVGMVMTIPYFIQNATMKQAKKDQAKKAEGK